MAAAPSWRRKALAAVVAAGLIVALGFLIHWYVINTRPPYVTVSLLGARGLDVDDRAGETPVEFDVAIGVLHLRSSLAVAHDSGQIAISYAGVKLAEGPVPKFYVAGGRAGWVEAARAVVPAAAADQAPLSQMFRDHIWVDQQMHGAAEFDVALRLFNVNITTGQSFYSYHACKAGLALDGEAKPSKCGMSTYFVR